MTIDLNGVELTILTSWIGSLPLATAWENAVFCRGERRDILVRIWWGVGFALFGPVAYWFFVGSSSAAAALGLSILSVGFFICLQTVGSIQGFSIMWRPRNWIMPGAGAVSFDLAELGRGSRFDVDSWCRDHCRGRWLFDQEHQLLWLRRASDQVLLRLHHPGVRVIDFWKEGPLGRRS